MNIDISVIVMIVGALVVLTNIIVEVAKKATWDKIPTNLLALIVSEVVSIASGVAYCQIEAISLTWYIILSFIVIGFMVAYAAMFGFDKFKEIVNLGIDKKTDDGNA